MIRMTKPSVGLYKLTVVWHHFFAAPISPNTYSGAERKMVDAPLQKPYPEAPLCILQFQTDSSLGQRRSSRVEGQEERGEWCGDSNPLH